MEVRKNMFGTEKEKASKGNICLALAAVGVVLSTAFMPVTAKPLNSDGLVDPEWESAVRKHVEKRFFNLIDATDSQKVKLDELFEQRCEANRSIREKIKLSAFELANLLGSESATDDQIRTKAEEVRALRSKLSDARLETAIKVRSLLSSEQRKVVSDKIAGFISTNQKRGLLRSMM